MPLQIWFNYFFCPPTHFYVILFLSSISFTGVSSTKSLGSLTRISMNHSLLSPHKYEAGIEAKLCYLMRQQCLWLGRSLFGADQHELLWRIEAQTSFITIEWLRTTESRMVQSSMQRWYTKTKRYHKGGVKEWQRSLTVASIPFFFLHLLWLIPTLIM